MIRLALALALLATPALAAKPKQHAAPVSPPSGMPCALKTDVLARLATKFHEAPAWIGKAESANTAMMLTQTPDGATWTLILLRQSSRGASLACMLASGTAGSGFATGSGT